MAASSYHDDATVRAAVTDCNNLFCGGNGGEDERGEALTRGGRGVTFMPPPQGSVPRLEWVSWRQGTKMAETCTTREWEGAVGGRERQGSSQEGVERNGEKRKQESGHSSCFFQWYVQAVYEAPSSVGSQKYKTQPIQEKAERDGTSEGVYVQAVYEAPTSVDSQTRAARYT